ncbi:hypothetical protein RHGRI_032080 [Rhododendron griersonianum]|uniref:GST N-terminal domain-containing protein n=1 Tax=Rhododendron griersonianum TaxID=479676 RepID=A0AAV6ICT6_9ERIC|nr:hypothetical protein RHGRI_032080 [Rhododendron griersonianum]
MLFLLEPTEITHQSSNNCNSQSGEQRGAAKEAEAIFQLPEYLLSPSSDCPQIERLSLINFWSDQSVCFANFRFLLKTLTIVLLMIELFLLLRFEFTKLNPIGYVPVLVDEDFVVSDSFAILLYLEEKYPQHPLLPRDLQRRAINYQVQVI